MTDTHGQNEYTPLLSVDDYQEKFPAIKTALESLSDYPDIKDLHDSYPRILDDIQPLHALAFRLILALELLISLKDIDIYKSHNVTDIMNALRDQVRRKEHMVNLIMSILDEMSASGDSSEAILVISFASERVRVLDRLNHPMIPHIVIRNDFFFLSLLRLWKLGASRLKARPQHNAFLHKYDATVSPRGLHAFHLLVHLGYLALLAHFVLYPVPTFGTRESLLVLYSVSSIAFKHVGFASFSHLLLILSFIFSLLSSSPLPNSGPYTFILGSLCLHILELPFPTFPNVFLLFDPVYWLPISSLYAASFRTCIIPAFIFLLPILFGFSLLLALSLSEEAYLYHYASPLTARSAFLGLFCISCILFIHLTLAMPNSLTEWSSRLSFSDRYGQIFGDQARCSLLRAVLMYSPNDDVLFLPPFNLLSLKKFPQGIRVWTWRIMVLPLALIAVFYRWITYYMQADT